MKVINKPMTTGITVTRRDQAFNKRLVSCSFNNFFAFLFGISRQMRLAISAFAALGGLGEKPSRPVGPP